MDIRLLVITVAFVITLCFFLVNLILIAMLKSGKIIYRCRFTKNSKVILKLYGGLLLGIPAIIAVITMIIKSNFIVIFGFLVIWYDLVFMAFYNMNSRTVLTSKGIGRMNLAGLVTIKNLYWENIKSYKWNNNILVLDVIMDSSLGEETVSIPMDDKEKVDGILKEQLLV